MTNIVVTELRNSLDLIRNEILMLDGVEYCEIIFNGDFKKCPFTDLPPVSFKVIVKGGKSKKVAKIIWWNKPIGVISVGSTSKHIKDSLGYKHLVQFEKVK